MDLLNSNLKSFENPENEIIEEKIIADELSNEKEQLDSAVGNTYFPTTMFSPGNAVVVTDVMKSYGKGKYSTPVLHNFNMEVQKGTIYSLLGSSGCGKTTILSSVVGLKKVDSGKILVYGSPAGTRASGVPGKRVGYMPQEIALVGEFSIEETMRYFGSLYGMDSELVKRNIDFLLDFLKLPPLKQRINTLSGGQQRRVSFAVALIHNPELLILDEPTVGVDPLLRKSIWSHLTSLTSTGKTTVIITTHYIEEARESHRVGLMRNGRLLAEDSPESLLKQYDTNLLENIVLKLCLLDNAEEIKRGAVPAENDIKFTSGGTLKKIKDENSNEKSNEKVVGLRYRKRNPDLWDPEAIRKWNDYQRGSVPNIFDDFKQETLISRMKQSSQRIVALSTKNTLMLTRNILFLLFLLTLPTLQIILICTAIGSNLRELRYGIVNTDKTSFNEIFQNQSFGDYDYEQHGCILHANYSGSASLHYISLIDQYSFKLINYATEEEALNDVLLTKLYGYFYIPENFTAYMKERILFGVNSELETIFGSKIDFHMDSSKRQITEEMKIKFYKYFIDFVDQSAVQCDIDKDRFETPIKFKTPVYGKDETAFTEFIAPSILLGMLFFFPLCATGVSYIKEEKNGILQRSRVAGVTKMEIMISFSITNFVLLIIQTLLAFAVMILVFNIEIKGSISLAIIIALCVGVSGISVGFLFAVVCTEEVQAVLLSQGTFFPNFIISGMIWPTICMPTALQYISLVLPCTLACESIRCIISRGLGFTHVGVWPGFLSIAMWIVVYWIATICLSKFTKAK